MKVYIHIKDKTDLELFNIFKSVFLYLNNTHEYFFEEPKGYDAVIHLSLSSGVSSTYSNAKKVASGMQNVYVIDTLSLSTGIALLAIKAHQMIDQGKDVKEIVESLENQKQNLVQ